MANQDSYTILAEKLGYGESPQLRRVLEYLMTKEQADLAAALPAEREDLARKFNLSLVAVNDQLYTLFRKGVVFPQNCDATDFKELKGWHFAPNIHRLSDGSQTSWLLDAVRHKKLFEFWEEFWVSEHTREKVLARGQGTPQLRVIPALKAILNGPQIHPWEDVRTIINEARVIALISCSCRKRKQSVGNGCARSHPFTCIQFDKSAEYYLLRGIGMRLTKAEALDKLNETEDNGLVHIWWNKAAMCAAMCNCCTDCCVMLEPVSTLNLPATTGLAKSRYEASVDQDECSGCKTCVKWCPFHAIGADRAAGSKKVRVHVDPEKCMGCGVCVLKCKTQSMKFKAVRPMESIPPAATAVKSFNSEGHMGA